MYKKNKTTGVFFQIKRQNGYPDQSMQTSALNGLIVSI